jgi:hypothetical protein
MEMKMKGGDIVERNKTKTKKTESIRSKSLKKGDKKLDGPNRPST